MVDQDIRKTKTCHATSTSSFRMWTRRPRAVNMRWRVVTHAPIPEGAIHHQVPTLPDQVLKIHLENNCQWTFPFASPMKGNGASQHCHVVGHVFAYHAKVWCVHVVAGRNLRRSVAKRYWAARAGCMIVDGHVPYYCNQEKTLIVK
jgi:hypothetical protein